jgi:hypothetical protein
MHIRLVLAYAIVTPVWPGLSLLHHPLLRLVQPGQPCPQLYRRA